MIVKTFVETDTTDGFLNPTRTEENGVVDHIDITGLTAETGYFVRAGVIDDQGNITYSENTETFTTTSAIPNYFYVQNVSNYSNTITLKRYGSPITGTTLAYSLDGNDWTTCTYDSSNNCDISLPYSGDKVYFRSSDRFSTNTINYYKFMGTQIMSIGGDITTLLDYTNDAIDTTPQNAFRACFQSNDQLVDASNLDCSKIVHSGHDGDFQAMFDGCYRLLYACDFPNLEDATYNIFGECFRNCTSLVRGSVISNITSVTSWGLQNMYQNCYNLREAWAPIMTQSSWPANSNGFMNNAGQDVTSGTKVIYVPTGAPLPPYPTQNYPWTIEYI